MYTYTVRSSCTLYILCKTWLTCSKEPTSPDFHNWSFSIQLIGLINADRVHLEVKSETSSLSWQRWKKRQTLQTRLCYFSQLVLIFLGLFVSVLFKSLFPSLFLGFFHLWVIRARSSSFRDILSIRLKAILKFLQQRDQNHPGATCQRTPGTTFHQFCVQGHHLSTKFWPVQITW